MLRAVGYINMDWFSRMKERDRVSSGRTHFVDQLMFFSTNGISCCAAESGS